MEFNDAADFLGLDDLKTAHERVERLVTDARAILSDAYTKGMDQIGLNAVMYDTWSPKLLDAIETQAQTGLEYGSPAGEDFSEADKQEYKLFCQEVLEAMPAIKADVQNGKYSLPIVPEYENPSL